MTGPPQKLWDYLRQLRLAALPPDAEGAPPDGVVRDDIIPILVGDAPNLNNSISSEGLPDELVDLTQVEEVCERVERYVGVPLQTQQDSARSAFWDVACRDLVGTGDMLLTEARELVSDAGYLLKGEGVALSGVDIEGALQAMDDMREGEEPATSLTQVRPEVLHVGLSFLADLAAVEAVFRSLQVASARQKQDAPHPVEGLVDEMDGELDVRYGELDIRGGQAIEDALLRKSCRPLGDDELEVLERPSKVEALPRRTRLLPFAGSAELGETIMLDTMRCWYAKTLDVDSPTIIDELTSNFRVPRKSEGQDVGDPLGVIAEAAFALHARLGPSLPHLGPAALVALWLSTMEGQDIDRLLKFNDTPATGATDGGGSESPSDAVTAEQAADEYAKKYSGRRNPSILHEISSAFRGVKDALDLPANALMVVVDKLDGLHKSFAGDIVSVEAFIKGQAPQRTEFLPYSVSLDYNHTLFFPLLGNSASVRVSVVLEDGKSIGSADLKYPIEGTEGEAYAVPIRAPEERGGAKAQPVLAMLTIKASTTTLDAETMSDLVETLGGDIHRIRAREKLSRWVKSCCLLQALSSTLDVPTARCIPAGAGAVQQHAALEKGSAYVVLPPAAAMRGTAPPPSGSACVVLSSESCEGIDAAAASYYPLEETVIHSPLSVFSIEDVQSGGSQEAPTATLSLRCGRLLDGSGLVVAAALRRFFQACIVDARRADKQLEDAHMRVMSERARNLIHLVQDGDTRVSVREEEANRAEQEPLSEAFPDFLQERLSDRMTPLPDRVSVSCLPVSSTPLAWCLTRATVPHLLSDLILLWYDKEGDVLDELMENLCLPSEASAFATLAQLASILAEVHREQPRNWAEILVCVMIAVEGSDLDRILLLDDTPPEFSSPQARQEYINRVGTSRNSSVLPSLCSALSAMTDQQLSASLALQSASTVRKAALTEPHRAQKDVVRKWIKTFGMIMHLCHDNEGDLYRCATPAPGETDRILGLETGPWCLWAAPSRAQRTPHDITARDSALKVVCVVRGLKQALDLTPYQRRHRHGDAAPAILIPPLTAFLAGERELQENNLQVELLCRDCMPVQHPAVLKWKKAIEQSSIRADQRLRDAFFDMSEAKNSEMLRRAQVSMGKKVYLPDAGLVHRTLEGMKEYRLLVKDNVLPKHCSRASVGIVGNVTDAVTTDIPDLRRNLLRLAAEMRDEILEEDELEEDTRPVKPQVVSVTFPDESLYVLPMDLLQVHPVSWLPDMPSRLRVTIRWAELHEAVKPPRVRTEIEGVETVYTTGASLSAPPEREAEAAGKSPAKSQVYDNSLADEELAIQPRAEAGEDPLVPVWEEEHIVDLDMLRLSEAPLSLTFGVFSEHGDEGVDDYDYDGGDDQLGEDELVVGAVTFAVSHYILLETIGNPRTFPLPLAHPGDHHTADAHTAAVSNYVPPSHDKGLLFVGMELLPDDVEEASAVSEPLPTRAADPLSWRAGEFASDRICTGCDAGGDDCVEAVYVCVHCDEKLCEDCWEVVHAPNTRREDHTRLLLFHHCDFCFVDSEVLEGDDASTPALWRCSDCALNLCKSCWYAEHKHPARRMHDIDKIFLYPGGEDGEWAYGTILAQTLLWCSDRFTSGAVTWKPQGIQICQECVTRDAVYSWPTVYAEGIGTTPLLLCNECMVQQSQDMENEALDAELAGITRPERPAITLLLEKCAVCDLLEGRPALQRCEECMIAMCSACWKVQHRHPLRRGHTPIDITPPLALTPDTEASRLLQSVLESISVMHITDSVETPQLHGLATRMAPLVWAADLRNQEAKLRREQEALRLNEESSSVKRDPQDPFNLHDGYIGSGGDIGRPERLTVEQAKQKCLAMPLCLGFTLQEHIGNIDSGESAVKLYKVLFKEKFNVNGPGTGWTSYEKIPEAGLCKHSVLIDYCERCQQEAKDDHLRALSNGEPLRPLRVLRGGSQVQAPVRALGEPIKDYLEALIDEAIARE